MAREGSNICGSEARLEVKRAARSGREMMRGEAEKKMLGRSRR